MAKISQATTSEHLDLDGIEGHYGPLGDYTVGFETYGRDEDPAPLFTGLPDDACQAPHWGVVLEGTLVFRYTDGSEDVIEAGEAYYAPPVTCRCSRRAPGLSSSAPPPSSTRPWPWSRPTWKPCRRAEPMGPHRLVDRQRIRVPGADDTLTAFVATVEAGSPGGVAAARTLAAGTIDWSAIRAEIVDSDRAIIVAEQPTGPILAARFFDPAAPTAIHAHSHAGAALVVEGRQRYERFERTGDTTVRLESVHDLTVGDVVWWNDPPDDIHRQTGMGDGAIELVVLAGPPDDDGGDHSQEPTHESELRAALVAGFLDGDIARLRPWYGDDVLVDVNAPLDAAEKIGGDIYVLACLLAINALRVGEACNANVADLAADRHHRTLRIIGKGDKPAVVPLTARTVHALDQSLADRDGGPLLRNRHGDRLNRESAGRAVRYISRRAGLPSASPRTASGTPR